VLFKKPRTVKHIAALTLGWCLMVCLIYTPVLFKKPRTAKHIAAPTLECLSVRQQEYCILIIYIISEISHSV
jgi:hypothetical protein